MFYKRILTLSIVAALCLLVVGLLPVHGEEEIYNKVVRLHVLANSDSAEDQAVKLAVRDAVLEVTVPLLQDCRTKEEAILLLEENRPLLMQKATLCLSIKFNSFPSSFPRAPTIAFAFLQASISQCASVWARARGKTGGAVSFRPCVSARQP